MQNTPDQSTDKEYILSALHSRAIILARKISQTSIDNSILEFVVIETGGEEYAIEGSMVKEVHRFEEMTPLPGMPRFFEGLVNVRGHILPVLNLQKFLSIPCIGIQDSHMVVVVIQKDIEIAIAADTVTGNWETEVDAIHALPATFSDVNHRYLKGITSDGVIVLNMAAILLSRTIIVNQQVENVTFQNTAGKEMKA